MHVRPLPHPLFVTATAVVAAGACASVVAGGRLGGTAVLAGQVLGDLAAAGLAAAAWPAARGAMRWVWGLMTGALLAWLLSDAAYLAYFATGGDGRAGTSVADAGWVAFNALALTAVAVLYAHIRPERGRQGALDAVAVSAGLVALGWALVSGPLHLPERVGALQVTFSLLYPLSALVAAAIVGWLILRAGGGARWMHWALAALLAQFAGEVTYVGLTASAGVDHHIAAWIPFSASAWLWAMAALEYRRAGGGRVFRGHRPPPAWSDAIPAGAMLAAVAALAWDAGPAGIAVVLAAAVASTRFVLTTRDNARLLAERGREAMTDPLTGVLNRRALARELGPALARSRQRRAPLAALAVDLDGFKAVNDSRGHGDGDALLVDVAGALAARLRRDDMLFRTGGDEFVALLPETGAGEAARVAERVRVGVREVAARRAVPVTASLGVAEASPHRHPDALLADADRALYAAKSQGRDRVVVAEAGDRAPTAGPAGA